MKVCVLIRVYDRIEDLKYCVEIIRNSWTAFEYEVIVVSNGKSQGYFVDLVTKSSINDFVELETNAGHLKGNAQLLQEGLSYISPNSDFTIILEADTWIYSDDLIKKYTNILVNTQAVWASAKWYTHLYSLATDFAIIKTDFLLSNTDIFEYTGFPECYAANYILNRGYKFLYIKENMLVHLPSYIKSYPFAPKGRFYMFPKSKMVTHHIEALKMGMDEKKYYFNLVSKKKYFETRIKKSRLLCEFIFSVAVFFSYCLPQKAWFFKTKQFAVVNEKY
jgi:hypothetical protein